MIIRTAIVLLGWVLLSGQVSMQEQYRIVSVTSVRNTPYSIAVLKTVQNAPDPLNEVQVLIDTLLKTTSSYSLRRVLRIGSKVRLNLLPVEHNPLEGLLNRGHTVLYIDEVKIYDLSKPVYYSPCLNSADPKANCKN